MRVSKDIGQAELFRGVVALIEEADTIAICAHTSPDGDAIGSGLALAEIIRAAWPDKRVTNLLADKDPVPRIYRFLPRSDTFVHAADYDVTPDLFICVDLSQRSRLADAEEICARARRVAVFDHHPSGDRFWDAGVVRPDAAAAGVIISEFGLHSLGALTPTMAQNLLCAIVTDTGRFQYQNADSEAFETASMLVDAGASPAEVALNVYQSDRLAYVRLATRVLARIQVFAKGRIAYSFATAEDIARAGVTLDELDGLIDLVRCIEGTQVALFLKEVDGGKVRGNLRSKCDLDVSGVAREMGGGGHRAAAGFTAAGTVDEVLAIVLPKLRSLFDGTASNVAGAADGATPAAAPAADVRGASR
ncbi:MAG: DHH family phosphoesterase [Coriobacteriaceae bacterium]|uniref:DHH family phosphoesterase n=1 Tax=Tractidigestivibacter sp. TaxID=2847320 RepID=UPI002A9128C5|nr:DHH family phosphoesterase [Tractidigestivibacter sp.]MCI6273820.1 DHH family phosphoesterase [Coriobacteriaceae bacterium]MCI6844519.1 DHH family phosphoesterase [Coriobacteriaceae bacterium]MCI7439109.1 DHH family phosphoesterase [Coriobacteriaceae bacterium]MDD7112478.1 DHH family phosphoesterase [Coriobacteriaceae bacterium]MDY5272015.1 DHH family phosphoesterase [Tractidigestivibacter sp.]